MRYFNGYSLVQNIEDWSVKEKRITNIGSAAFYIIMIFNFLFELIHFENSLGLEKGFEGMGGINFLKSDAFFLIFTLSIIFLEYYTYILYNSIKGPIARINKEKNIEDLFKKRRKSSLMFKKIQYFFILISLIYILDTYVKIFFELLYQFIIIELFLHFIFCFIEGTTFFSLIIVTLDTKILKDSIYEKKEEAQCLPRVNNVEKIFQLVVIIMMILMVGNLFLLFKIFI